MGRQSRTLCQFTDLHEHLFSSRRKDRYELERTLSQGLFALKNEAPDVAPQAALSAAPGPRQRRDKYGYFPAHGFDERADLPPIVSIVS
jgi:hypothetical protein